MRLLKPDQQHQELGRCVTEVAWLLEKQAWFSHPWVTSSGAEASTIVARHLIGGLPQGKGAMFRARSSLMLSFN
jgi:hypothetical protein